MTRHIVVIGGSVRPNNYTAQACRFVCDELEKHPEVTYEWIDPIDLVLGLPGQEVEGRDAEMLQEKVAAATGVILSTPEYHGGISSVCKLIIDNLDYPSKLAGKPVGMVGVAAGAIGAIKALEQLQSICTHVGSIVLPGSASVARCHETLRDQEVQALLAGVAQNMISYIDNHICPKIALENMVRNNH